MLGSKGITLAQGCCSGNGLVGRSQNSGKRHGICLGDTPPRLDGRDALEPSHICNSGPCARPSRRRDTTTYCCAFCRSRVISLVVLTGQAPFGGVFSCLFFCFLRSTTRPFRRRALSGTELFGFLVTSILSGISWAISCFGGF